MSWEQELWGLSQILPFLLIICVHLAVFLLLVIFVTGFFPDERVVGVVSNSTLGAYVHSFRCIFVTHDLSWRRFSPISLARLTTNAVGGQFVNFYWGAGRSVKCDEISKRDNIYTASAWRFSTLVTR